MPRSALSGIVTLLLAASCAAPSLLSPEVEPDRTELIATMRDASTRPVPKPKRYVDAGTRWRSTWGDIVASDGPMIAVRLQDDPDDQPRPAWIQGEYWVAGSVMDTKFHLCVIAAWRGELALCRCFDVERDAAAPAVGDLVRFHPGQSRALTKLVHADKAEWFPAKPER